jgi:tetratricopeptide (TPR) repeat protein
MIIQKISVIFILLHLILINTISSQETKQTSKALRTLADIDTTMWRYLSATDRSQWTITKQDSEKAIKEYIIPGATTIRKTTDVIDRINKGRTTYEQEASNLISLLEEARDYFEEGLRLNPFDSYIRPLITRAYSQLEQLYAFKSEPVKRLQPLKNLLFLNTDMKERVYLYYNIGMIYRGFEKWEPARDNFQLAVEAIFEGDESAIDTTKLFENIYFRGEAQLKLYEDEPALTSFTYAKMIAPNENLYNRLENNIEFINWDAGNIRASEKFNDARRLSGEKKYEEAEIAFLELLGIVKTEKATNQAQLALTRMQFYQLDKKDEAIDRLWNVVNKYPLDSSSGVPLDSTYQDLWEQYSQMSLRMGLDNYNIDKRSSFTYFLKTSQIEGSSRGKAFLNIAMMSHQNPQICLDFCMRALDYQEQLNQEEKMLLYQTIHQAYLKQGNFEEALKWFKKYREMMS